MYKYLLFDADDTLLDFKSAERSAVWVTLEDSPIGCSEDIYRRYHIINDEQWKKLERGETSRDILRVERFRILFEEFGLDGAAALSAARAAADIYVDKLSLQSQLMPDAERVLSALSKKYDIYIITNGISCVQRARMGATPLSKYILRSYISEEMDTSKPDPEFFTKVTEDIGDRDRSAYLVIGDSVTSDIAGAKAADMDCVWIGSREKSHIVKATYTVEKLCELLEIL